MRNILKRPLLTEKSTAQNEKGVYVFLVDKKANKLEIKAAVAEMYPEVVVEGIRTAVNPGKPKMRYTKSGYTSGTTGAYKKAFVKLREGDSIDFFSEN